MRQISPNNKKLRETKFWVRLESTQFLEEQIMQNSTKMLKHHNQVTRKLFKSAQNISKAMKEFKEVHTFLSESFTWTWTKSLQLVKTS